MSMTRCKGKIGWFSNGEREREAQAGAHFELLWKKYILVGVNMKFGLF